MRKIIKLILSIFLSVTCVSCVNQEEKRKQAEIAAIDQILEERLTKTETIEGIYVILEKYEFIFPSQHEDIYGDKSFNLYYTFDTDVFTKEEIKGYSGTSIRLTLKETALSTESFETYIKCNAVTMDGLYNKIFTKKVIMPSWEYCIGYIYKGSATNFKMFDNNGKEGFYLQTQYISSGHFYEDTYVELDIPNELVKYKVVEYEKDTGGSYNFSTNEAVYYYGKQKISINNSSLEDVSILSNAEKGSFEVDVRGMVKKFDRIYNNIGLIEYVSCLSK